jgi:hypothetical protein
LIFSFRQPEAYTGYLSGFIKIAQLLVIQRSVVAVKQGEAVYPGDILDEMQLRFMVYGTRSPMNWAQKLWGYGKRIRETSTCLGHMKWSDNGQHLSYRGLELSKTQFGRFVQHQIKQLQAQLEELLLVSNVNVPPLDLQALKDNPGICTPGWSFLKDPRNAEQLAGGDSWLLDYVLGSSELQERFLLKPGSTTWKSRAVDDYLKKVDAFLERLAVVVHFVSGQPARGTELFSIMWMNTVLGFRRSVTARTECYSAKVKGAL